jgi:hypothetical protein
MVKKHSRRKNKTRRKYRGGSSTPIVFTLTNSGGFASTANYLCKAYIHAKNTNRDFFVENDNWKYAYKEGWHDYFKSLKTLPVNPPEDFKRYKHPVNNAGINDVPAGLFKKYKACAKDIFTLNDDLAKRAQDYIDTMGKPYKAVYVRMGDKVSGATKESDPVPLADIVKMMELPEGSKLFVMTDDYTIKEELEKLLPSVKLFTLTPPENKGSTENGLRKLPKEEMKKHAEELFMSIKILTQAEKAWVWNSSNLGRFMKMLSPDNLILYPMDNKTANNNSIDPSSGVFL